jgi:hypothetical protein
MIHKYYDTDNPEKEQLREFAFLDSSRHPEYPDDLAVFLLHEDHKPERVWVRGDHLTENEARDGKCSVIYMLYLLIIIRYTMLRGGISDPRNKAIMKILNLIAIGEHAGSGVPDIYSVWADKGSVTE